MKYSMIHPRTPDPYEEASKRQFDGRVKAWRRQIHQWDCMEDIAQVEIQVQQAGSGDNEGAMEGVVETHRSRRPLIAMAPVCTPNSTVIGKPHIPSSSGRHKVPAVEQAPEPGECTEDPLFKGNASAAAYGSYGGAQEEEEVLPQSKRFRTETAAAGTGGCIGEDEGALDGVDYDCAGGDDDDDDVL